MMTAFQHIFSRCSATAVNVKLRLVSRIRTILSVQMRSFSLSTIMYSRIGAHSMQGVLREVMLSACDLRSAEHECAKTQDHTGIGISVQDVRDNSDSTCCQRAENVCHCCKSMLTPLLPPVFAGGESLEI